MSPKYVVITPVRDEERNLRFTIESMIRQTILPAQWVIVNDGSTDRTGDIIDEFAAQHPWIVPIHRENRGFRKSGGGVVEAFNTGYEKLTCSDWDFIVKLDGDLSFDPGYFGRCFQLFDQDPKLGLGGGVIVHIINGEEHVDMGLEFHVRGATKIYRRACWDGLGGLWPAPGWDTYDEVKANRLGWKTKSFPDIRLIHHKLTGSADGQWLDLVKNGRANWICGYHPLFMLSKCVRRLLAKPYLIGSCALSWGFISGYLKRIPRVDDRATIDYLQQQQIFRLLGRNTIWR